MIITVTAVALIGIELFAGVVVVHDHLADTKHKAKLAAIAKGDY